MPLIFFLYEKKNVILSNSLYTNNKQNQQNQKYHFGLTSTSFSVNSWYWYHSPPPFPIGIRTRMDNFNCLAISSKFEPEVLSDLPIGSTGIHPRPEIAKSHAGLHKHKLRNFWSMYIEEQNLVIISISKIHTNLSLSSNFIYSWRSVSSPIQSSALCFPVGGVKRTPSSLCINQV